MRRRMSGLYETRRRRILEEPRAALEKFGIDYEVAEGHRQVRARLDDDIQMAVGFTGRVRIFGALLDTLWVTVDGDPGQKPERVSYHFKHNRFVTRSQEGFAGAVADRANRDSRVRNLISEGELKHVRLLVGPNGQRVEIVPMPGTITAIFIPPMPPYTVPIRQDEADAQLQLLLHLTEICRG
jgi:hypothetical protein